MSWKETAIEAGAEVLKSLFGWLSKSDVNLKEERAKVDKALKVKRYKMGQHKKKLQKNAR